MKIKVIFIIMLFGGISQTRASELIDLVNTYKADTRALQRTYSMEESQEYYSRFTTFYKDWKGKVEGIDFQALSPQGKIDYVLIKNLIKKDSYLFSLDYNAFKEIAHVTDFADGIYKFIKERRRGKRPISNELADVFTLAGKTIDNKMSTLKKIPFKGWMQAEKAAKSIASLRKGLKEAYSFYYDYDPEFTWWMKMPYAKLEEKLISYEEFLRQNYSENSVKDDGSGIIGQPIGKDALIENLKLEFIPYTPEQLIKTAEKQFEWCKAEMIKASEELGYGKDWKAALEHVKNTYVPPGKQPEAIMELYNKSIKFIEDRNLITLPEMAKENWGMIMMTPERQKVNPFFTGGTEISISYPTEGMSHDDKLMSMRGNNPNFSFPTVQHELLPGHNLQFFMTTRQKNYRNAFSTPFWVEGWALYWEIILWNKGFPQTPEQKIGSLFWRIHRCARIIFSLKYHLGELTPQECIDLLVNEVGHEYANAEAEVRRSFTTRYPPLYQLAYMMGGLQFYALRNEILAKGWTEKEFHDRVMQEGRIPVELLRNLLLEIPVYENYKTNWKFSTEFK
ncbi:DUF885 family protein [Arenibacter sp. M-2]|uniref:DUF885 family protein n=1 Tax=Arenibacter sp. M-2 TaxID=3053612 RepID=UPI0025701A94|nr:DUF885 family protein [Arenibacter sp. M-2]MDL5512060.1 DUF885 family protein [Arenibacter sp. M-2]